MSVIPFLRCDATAQSFLISPNNLGHVFPPSTESFVALPLQKEAIDIAKPTNRPAEEVSMAIMVWLIKDRDDLRTPTSDNGKGVVSNAIIYGVNSRVIGES